MDVAIYKDGVDDVRHKTYLLLTDTAVRAVRVVEEEPIGEWCVVGADDGCQGTYDSENEAFDELRWPWDSVVPANECSEGHSKDYQE